MSIKDKISNELKFEGNPRKINNKQKELLKKHIEELGDLSGVVYCQNNKAYVGGNQRSDIFDGAKIEIVKEFKKPNKVKTIANGYIVYNGERYAYREVKFDEEQFKKACIVANNDGGENDWEILKSDKWENSKLSDWGLDTWWTIEEEEVDYSVLDDKDLDNQIDEMQSNVKKAIQIEFELEHYEEARELIKYWRERDAYVGAMIIEKLKAEKEKI